MMMMMMTMMMMMMMGDNDNDDEEGNGTNRDPVVGHEFSDVEAMVRLSPQEASDQILGCESCSSIH